VRHHTDHEREQRTGKEKRRLQDDEVIAMLLLRTWKLHNCIIEEEMRQKTPRGMFKTSTGGSDNHNHDCNLNFFFLFFLLFKKDHDLSVQVEA